MRYLCDAGTGRRSYHDNLCARPACEVVDVDAGEYTSVGATDARLLDNGIESMAWVAASRRVPITGWACSLTSSGTVGVIAPEGLSCLCRECLATILRLSDAIPLSSYIAVSL
jgi:hypothetical protein